MTLFRHRRDAVTPRPPAAVPAPAGQAVRDDERDPVAALNRAWELDRAELLGDAIRRANRIALAGLATGVLGIAAAALFAGLHREVPIVVTVDRTTGETVVGAGTEVAAVPANDALDKAELARYVEAREGYDYNWLQRDYDRVAATSTAEVFAEFAPKYAGREALHLKLARAQLWKVSVRVVTPVRAPRAQAGEASVTWDLQQISLNGQFAPRTLSYVSTLRYAYNPAARMTESARRISPLGFLVTAYRRDEETRSAP